MEDCVTQGIRRILFFWRPPHIIMTMIIIIIIIIMEVRMRLLGMKSCHIVLGFAYMVWIVWEFLTSQLSIENINPKLVIFHHQHHFLAQQCVAALWKNISAFEKPLRGRLKGKKLVKKVLTKAPKKLSRWVPQLCIVVTTGMIEPVMVMMMRNRVLVNLFTFNIHAHELKLSWAMIEGI